MLDEAGQELKRWLSELPGSPQVGFRIPDADSPSPAIGLYFVEIRHKPPVRDALRSAWAFQLRYLLTTSGPDPLAAQRLLGAALIAALQRDGVEVDNESPSTALWQALGIRPQPAFFLCVPWHYQKELPRPSLVTQPLELHTRRMRQLVGRVLGPNDVPVMGATVEAPSLGRSATTDHEGRFDLSAAPRGINLTLRVTAKGCVIQTRVDDATDTDGNLLVKVPLPQGAGSLRSGNSA